MYHHEPADHGGADTDHRDGEQLRRAEPVPARYPAQGQREHDGEYRERRPLVREALDRHGSPESREHCGHGERVGPQVGTHCVRHPVSSQHSAAEMLRASVLLVPDRESVAEIRGGVLRLARRLRAERQPGALTSNQVAVLSHLRRHGPSTPGEIAATDGQQPQSLTRTFNELQLAGLVTRSRSPRDGRESVLTLTTRGGKALRADMAQRDEWLAGALTGLSDAELALLRVAAGLLDRLATTPAPAEVRPLRRTG